MEIECEFDNFVWVVDGKKREFYTCTVKSANISEPATTIKSFEGKHSEGKTDKDVEALDMQDTVVEFLPKGLSEFFPKLKLLRMRNCGLQEISRLDLEGLEELEALRVGKNKLSSIPDDLFEGKKKLTEVIFESNSLTNVNSELLEPVKDTLKYADFEDNPGINMYFYVGEDYTFGDMMIDMMDKLNDKSYEINELEKQLAVKDQRLEICEGNLAATAKKHEGFSKTFKELQTSGTLSDLLVVRGKEFKVHKCIMAAQSSVFKEILSNGATVQETIKREGDFSDEVFEDFFQFFYTQEVKNEEHTMDLLELAVEYKVPQLKNVCEENAIKNLNGGNALEIYNSAHRQSLGKLKRAAFELIKTIHHDVGEYLYDEPEVVNAIIRAELKYKEKHSHPAKKPRLDDD